MKVVLTAIRPSDSRSTAELPVGEIVEHEVDLEWDGHARTFTVFLQARMLETLDASVLHGEPLIEELLRFEPRALATLLSMVGRARRPEPVMLPLVLVHDDTDKPAGLDAH